MTLARLLLEKREPEAEDPDLSGRGPDRTVLGAGGRNRDDSRRLPSGDEGLCVDDAPAR